MRQARPLAARRTPGLRAGAVIAAAMLVLSGEARAGKQTPTNASSTSIGAPAPNDAVPRITLGPLPKPPSLEVPPPTPASLEALDAHLARLSGRDAADRETAVQEILEVEPDRLAAIHRRLTTIAESSDHTAMKELLGSIRDKAREDTGKKGAAPDYLEMLEAHARPDSKTFRDLVSVVAMSRMLRQIGSVVAARELVSIYARFGDFLRIDTQLQLEKMGDRAVAALVEAERHPAPKISQWAGRQLDMLGKAIPGEAVQTADPEVLADILRAYGRARNPDAARLVISFANSERTQIRDAARQAVVLMGEVSNWQLRDTYENVVGKKPPREWSWERTARELFAEYDRLRLSQVYVLFEQGLAAFHAGKLEDMAQAFDQVLAQSPTFERAAEMVPGYLAFAKTHLDDAPEKAVRALRRVDRLTADTASPTRPARSLLVTLQAEELFARHVADQTLVRHALELDPENHRAARLLGRMLHGEVEAEGRSRRYVAAGVIAAVALAALAFIGLRKRAGPAPAPPAAPPIDDARAEPVVESPGDVAEPATSADRGESSGVADAARPPAETDGSAAETAVSSEPSSPRPTKAEPGPSEPGST